MTNTVWPPVANCSAIYTALTESEEDVRGKEGKGAARKEGREEEKGGEGWGQYGIKGEGRDRTGHPFLKVL